MDVLKLNLIVLIIPWGKYYHYPHLTDLRKLGSERLSYLHKVTQLVIRGARMLVRAHAVN